MNGLALAAALALAQVPEAPAPERTPAAAPDRPAPAAPEAVDEARGPVIPSVAPPEAARSRGTPSPVVPSVAPPSPVVPSVASPEATRNRGTRSRGTPAPPSPLVPSVAPPQAARSRGTAAPLPERDDAERAARTFLEALSRGDATALAQVASDRFSFDGDVQAGRETIRRTWRELLAARPPAPPPAVGALEVLQATDAAARFGKPPVRLAPLVRHGVLVAIGDVGGRTVVLFVAREGGRMAVLGMHD